MPHKGDTVVGNDVWMGYDSLVMPGIAIGHGAIVATRSVFTSDIPPYTIVGGNPARKIRQRFPDETIEALLEIAWWDWPVVKITRNLSMILASNLEALRSAG
jgi:virginiamycin A acetyltransferase